MEKKHLKISAGLVDLTDVQPEALTHYHAITVSSGVVLVTPRTRRLLAEFGAILNCGGVIDVPDGCQLNNINGGTTLTEHTQVVDNTVLLVNGHLRLAPGSQETIRKYAKIMVNGPLILPEGLQGQCSGIIQNGQQIVYPDGADYVEGNIQINDRFLRRIKKDAAFFTRSSAFLIEENVDVQALLDQNILIHAKTAYVSENYPDGELLFDSNAQIISVPAGFRVIQGNLTLDQQTEAEYGKKLFVVGKCRVEMAAKNALESLEKIIVAGEAQVDEDLMDLWQARCVKADKVTRINQARKIKGMDSDVIISKEMLALCPRGLEIIDCKNVIILPDVEAAFLSEKILKMRGVSLCVCTQEQQSVLQLVCEFVDFAREKPEKKKAAEDEETKVLKISAGFYKL
ncbi:MAG: hypothetical protein E7336_11960 [Clostridiales bacterium]|nr:hypothetical protein [Clostridiales bacterium]